MVNHHIKSLLMQFFNVLKQLQFSYHGALLISVWCRWLFIVSHSAWTISSSVVVICCIACLSCCFLFFSLISFRYSVCWNIIFFDMKLQNIESRLIFFCFERVLIQFLLYGVDWFISCVFIILHITPCMSGSTLYLLNIIIRSFSSFLNILIGPDCCIEGCASRFLFHYIWMVNMGRMSY